MNPLDTDREAPRPARRPGHDRDDSRQERERDYVKEVRPQRTASPRPERSRAAH